MSGAVLVGIALLGGAGAVARFTLDGAVSDRARRDYPYGTLVVNVAGAFLLGLVAGSAFSNDAYRLAGTGLLGSFTTFSTWAFESHRLAENGQFRLSAINFVVSLALGVAAVALGRHIGASL